MMRWKAAVNKDERQVKYTVKAFTFHTVVYNLEHFKAGSHSESIL